MEKGFSLIETIISLTLSLFVLLFTSLFVDFVREEILLGKERMENLQGFYSGIDMIGNEIKRCGLGLSHLWETEDFKIFQILDDTIFLRRGDGKTLLSDKALRGEDRISVDEPFKFKEGREIVVTNFIKFENKKIKKKEENILFLSEALKNDYSERSLVIQINYVSFKYDRRKKVLRMSQNSGPFQPLIENIEGLSFKKEGNSLTLKVYFDKKIFNFVFFNSFGGEP